MKGHALPLTLVDLYRTPVYSAKGKRIGKVVEVLFDPERAVVVGLLVQRPRILYMLDRRDKFLAFDSAKSSRDAVDVTSTGKDAWDKQAAKRLGLDWDATVVWSKMPVKTESGTQLGRVGDVEFDEKTGVVEAIKLSSGTAADLAVGTRCVEGMHVHGYRDGAVRVADVAAEVEPEGGAAGVAGKASVVAKKQMGEAATAAGAAVGQAVVAGKKAAQAAAQTQTGKKAIGWLKAMRDEVVDAMGDPDDD